MRIYEWIGQRVQARREECGLTQAQLATAAGLARSSIANLEIGMQRVPLEQLLRIAVALECDYRELLPAPEDLVTANPGPLTVDMLSARAPATAQFLEALEQGSPAMRAGPSASHKRMPDVIASPPRRGMRRKATSDDPPEEDADA